MTETVERFSNRVENYIRYRPSYPAGVLQLLKDQTGFTSQSVVADIGSGPGISARQFLENGNTVYCVEPNEAMRQAAEALLGQYPGFKSVKGDSENTTLPDESIDLIAAAQAFHWFRPEPTKTEFKRVIKPGGYAALIWNIRLVDSTPFLVEYEQFIMDNANDYAAVRHENVTDRDIGDFFDGSFESGEFDNVQVFDFDGLNGRLFSSSYMPAQSSPSVEKVEAKLRGLFEKHARGGKIEIPYTTKIFYSKL